MRRNPTKLVLATLVAAAMAVPSGAVAASDPQPHPAVPNSELPGSSCVPGSGGVRYTEPGPGISTSALGDDAPAYYEVGAPNGDFTGQRAKGVMIVIHGGGWYRVGKAIVSATRSHAERWREAGWKTVNIDYRGCEDSVADVLWFMDRVRSKNANAVICATGRSAGGHLALMLAALRPDLACAISAAGPSDLVGLDGQPATDRYTGEPSYDGPRRVSNLAIAAFGSKPAPLAVSSPQTYAHAVKARLLLATGRRDILIPAAQDQNFAAAVRAAQPTAYVDVLALPPGRFLFVHSLVSRDALRELRRREDALVAPLVQAAQGGLVTSVLN